MTGAEMRAIRESLGLTQAELSDWLGLSGPVHVSILESGRRRVPGPVHRCMRILEQTGGAVYDGGKFFQKYLALGFWFLPSRNRMVYP